MNSLIVILIITAYYLKLADCMMHSSRSSVLHMTTLLLKREQYSDYEKLSYVRQKYTEFFRKHRVLLSLYF
ncbi:hypothetical protein EMCG_02852 [[Emmonsia] crescens]|uniref:Uncharacterized protein n=1 Tax=[Emmonsia] crescens TaxID=73230 RepID=A0A0G2J8T6_9EURO|nr:hypothetical protein EMCG_02852 [Emmonsia crescens UAMH 3008]